ncbi:hypothetical protein JK2ML_0030 [Mycobacterium leprae Kyoto-2]|uniref:Uncharacterized protein ML0030 n=3 Tax=Mycobacterium leprae TaxID=1769 RepID=Y030_MYCLE|nr:hypothetical protein [Mycobacterium leprae]O32871.1 RecName: Full=Uncharacterized protein ML0030 [Mycobacterium leprae TN]CAR70123.1 putative membrane protein [Mycobacterium leprae Br4923]AWV47045.1 hypothetical protein DIJ64_00160 [Mycobacterium leprae]OAR19536.1 hypothetical protein A8144_04515 [Mycobacterium leprae 3125609]OAX71569.1 hypothetical protein A3216_05125 [Mycobacterium leprae 7935681]CAA94725.1 hypothetical protein [Mycobacterium leprae]
MLIAGTLCVCAAVISAVFGTWALIHNQTVDPTQLAMRAMAPPQLAAAIMLAAGGVVALVAVAHTALIVVAVCVTGAVGTLAAGSWQSARYTLRRRATATSCGKNCAGCILSCR